MTKPLHIGLIGAGMVSRHHLIGWRELAGQAKVVAIADPSEDNAGQRASEFDIPAIFPDAAAMLDNVDLGAVDIAAPRALHAPLVRLVAERGIPILCQKPLAPTLREAEQLIADVGTRTRLMVHENWRFRGYYRDAAAWLHAGKIGRIKQAQLTLMTSGVLAGTDGKRPALERQPFMRHEKRLLVAEVLIHHLDTLRVLLGEMQVRSAGLSRTYQELAGEDGAVIQLETGDGAAVSVFASFAAHGHPATQVDRLDILGETGAIRLDGDMLRCLSTSPEDQRYDLATEYQGSYTATIRHFIDCLTHDRPFETSPEDNLKTLRLVEDCYRLSGWEGA
ncbi:Gfo/Idh/MocA family oxidoreductase [Bradyrhizobium prioriisuperbiae]|uniref:Gfo/Idh/MocA family protein n=1 Tax=Bradyrhizobium prioriisuperbiae TaxID=2854389 RepID=UPI0028E28927|nr:Gfo/Idh/MocA family oxidoreductase [Bradyrhizobium prioritasuperba]